MNTGSVINASLTILMAVIIPIVIYLILTNVIKVKSKFNSIIGFLLIIFLIWDFSAYFTIGFQGIFTTTVKTIANMISGA